MKKKKISILLPDLRGGGVESLSLVLAHEFAGEGHTVEFVLMQGRGELLVETRTSFLVHDLACSRSRYVPFALARYLRRNRPDVLLSAIWPLTVLAPLARYFAGIDCHMIVSEHNTLSVQYKGRGHLHRTALRASMAIGYRLANARIAVSMGLVEDISQLSGLPRDCFSVIHNPICLRSTPSPKALAEAETFWGVPSGARVLTVGSLKAQKNQSLLLRAFARMGNADARLIIVGAGGDEETLRRLAANLGVTERVIFAGFRANPSPFYATADLFVLSSDYEGFGNVIVEALACGLPVVSTDCPSGPAEILENGRHGRLVPVGQTQTLAHAMEAALANPGNPRERKRRAAHFSPHTAAKKYLDLMLLEKEEPNDA